MRPVTDLVFEKALEDAAQWMAVGKGVPVAVNLFAALLRDRQLPVRLCRALEDRGPPADRLTVEITEDVVLNDLSQVTAVLRGYVNAASGWRSTISAAGIRR